MQSVMCIGGLQLAHVASHEGITAVEHIAGLKSFTDRLYVKFQLVFIVVQKQQK